MRFGSENRQRGWGGGRENGVVYRERERGNLHSEEFGEKRPTRPFSSHDETRFL